MRGKTLARRSRVAAQVRPVIPGEGSNKIQMRECYCVYNTTRESFLSLGVVAADTHVGRLKGLLGRARLKADEGLWVIPSQGVHSIGVLFPVDLVYLDSSQRVVHLIESFGTFRIGPIRRNCDSVLQLPVRTIYASQTQVGDQLRIAPLPEMEAYLEEHQKQQKMEPQREEGGAIEKAHKQGHG